MSTVVGDIEKAATLLMKAAADAAFLTRGSLMASPEARGTFHECILDLQSSVRAVSNLLDEAAGKLHAPF